MANSKPQPRPFGPTPARHFFVERAEELPEIGNLSDNAPLVQYFRLGALAGAIVFVAATAKAHPALYLFYGTMSGDLNGNVFSDKAYVIKVNSDTSLLSLLAPGVWSTPADQPSTITIADVGTLTSDGSKDPAVFHNQSLLVPGFWRYGGLDMLNINSTLASTYDLASSIGPVTGPTYPLNQFQNVATDMGLLSVASVGNGEATFQAIIETVPEPGTMAVLAVGVLALRKRRRK